MIALTKGANSNAREDEEAAQPIQRSEQAEEVRRLQARCAEGDRDHRDCHREPAQLQREQELAHELAPVGVGRADRGGDRPAGQDDHVPDLLEQRFCGQECPVSD